MEVRLGHCTKGGMYDPCTYCENIPFVKPSPRPYPDYSALPEFKHLDVTATPRENRTVDDFLPRAHIKDWFKHYKIESSNVEQVREFSDIFIVKPDLVTTYVKHLEHLEIKKKKRAEKRHEERKKPNVPTPQVEDSSSSSSESEDSDDETIAVIGSSSSDSDTDMDDTNQQPLRRSLRKRTTFRTRRFYGDSD